MKIVNRRHYYEMDLDFPPREGALIEGQWCEPHPNGGGLVSKTAYVAPTAFVGYDAKVLDHARVLDQAVINADAIVAGSAVIKDRAIIDDHAKVLGRAVVYGEALIYGEAIVTDHAVVDTTVSGQYTIQRYSWISASEFPENEKFISDHPWILEGVTLDNCDLEMTSSGGYVYYPPAVVSNITNPCKEISLGTLVIKGNLLSMEYEANWVVE